MLTIRLQRTGRSGHAQFRVVIQDSRFSPTSGRVVSRVGSYNPHTKAVNLDKEKITGYLSKGAQPSPRVAGLLKKEGIKLPGWVKIAKPSKKSVKHPEKLRRNRPAPTEKSEPQADSVGTGEPAPVAKPEAEGVSSEEAPAEEVKAEETPAEESVETEVKNVEEKAEPEAPAEEITAEEQTKPAPTDEPEPRTTSVGAEEEKEEPKAEEKS